MFHFNQDNRTFIEHIWMNSLGIIFPGVMSCVFLVSIAGAQVPFPEIPDGGSKEPKLWPNTILPLPPAPDYASAHTWALNPELSKDTLDGQHGHQPAHLGLPKGRKRNAIPHTLPPGADADVFFIHPTMLLEGSALSPPLVYFTKSGCLAPQKAAALNWPGGGDHLGQHAPALDVAPCKKWYAPSF